MGSPARLGRELERQGLAAFLAAFPPHSARRDRWAREAGSLDGTLRALVGLFLLGEAVELDALPPAVAEAVPSLADADAAETESGTVRLRDVALLRPFGVWLLAELPGPLVVRSYFGPDSLALAGHATYRADGRCLDLCAGPGFQGLFAAGRCRSATLVELLPEVARLAKLNAELNGLDGRVDVRCGDLYAPLDGERYDHLVANVPFIAVPPGRPFPLAGAGGEDGFAVGRRVLAGLPAHLADDGTAHLAALLFRNGRDLVFSEELAAWAREAGRSVQAVLTAELPVAPDSGLVRATAAAIASSSEGADEDEIAAEVTDGYRRLGATSASWTFLRIDPGPARVTVLDLGRRSRVGPWVSLT